MDFKRAITTAAKFVGEDGIYSRLRAIPAGGPFPARIFAQNEQVGVLCDLDAGLDVPNCTLDTLALLSMVKDGQISKFGLDMDTVTVEVGASKYRLEDTRHEAYSPRLFRGFPALPSHWENEPDWNVVQKILHVAPKKHPNPARMHVCFRPGGDVACFDEFRFARVRRANRAQTGGVVPRDLFKSWPAREVWSFFDMASKTAFFRIGADELRMASMLRDTFPDWSRYDVPHAGHEMVVDRADFLQNIKRALALSPNGSVRLDVAPGSCTISAWNEQPQTYINKIWADATAPGLVAVSGKYLTDVLSEISTPNIWIGYCDNYQMPLRVEAPGDFLELIWVFDPNAAKLDANGNLSGKQIT